MPFPKCECGLLLKTKKEQDDGLCEMCMEDFEANGALTPEERGKKKMDTEEKKEKKKYEKKKHVIHIDCEQYQDLYDTIYQDAKKQFRSVSMQALLKLAEIYKYNL